MPRTTAGRGYPHATTQAREHDHRVCAIVEKIADRVTAGAEQWGVIHPMPPVPDEATARKMRSRFFTAKFCKILGRKYGELMSVRCEYQQAANGWVLTVQVWPRSVARAEITRRVRDGEELHYNPLAPREQ
jgi:hypothetical protein